MRHRARAPPSGAGLCGGRAHGLRSLGVHEVESLVKVDLNPPFTNELSLHDLERSIRLVSILKLEDRSPLT